MKQFFKGLLKLLLYILLFFTGAAALGIVSLIFAGIVILAKKMGNVVPIILCIVFIIVIAANALTFFGIFCSSFMVMVSPKKYNAVDVEIVDVDVSDGVDYGPYYWPVVIRTDDPGEPPHKSIPNYESYNSREEVEALIGTHMTLYASDDAPYELFYKHQMKRSSSIPWTLSMLLATLFFVWVLVKIANYMIGLWSGNISFWS
ncbi:MAG: hypothetical protein PUG54_01490 [Firmicutes bacterium]|nr:hypothetical protein [Bacillota bacterium]